MRIMYINNDGGGFADHITIDDNTTVQQLFNNRVPHGSPSDYLIRVNRQPSTRDQQLREGDRVSFTPTKIEGASRADTSPTRVSRFWRSVKSALASTASSVRKQVQRWRRQPTND